MTTAMTKKDKAVEDVIIMVLQQLFRLQMLMMVMMTVNIHDSSNRMQTLLLPSHWQERRILARTWTMRVEIESLALLLCCVHR